MSKPEWATLMDNALDMGHQAEVIKDEALQKRCAVTDSGGARCTADAWPQHAHRVDREDLPR